MPNNKGWHLQGKSLHDMTILYLQNHRELLAGSPEECAQKYLEVYIRMGNVKVDIDPKTLSCK